MWLHVSDMALVTLVRWGEVRPRVCPTLHERKHVRRERRGGAEGPVEVQEHSAALVLGGALV